VVEVGGKRLEVTLPAGFGAGTPASAGAPAKAARKRSAGRKQAGGAGGDALTSPMQGTIVKIAVAEGDTVAEGDLMVVLEAMKMEQPLNAHKAGVVTGLAAAVGEVVPAGTVICEIK
jgi:acetyl-CoA/propionyl-CoA carboxylase biotin carboxyl carrier protein